MWLFTLGAYAQNTNVPTIVPPTTVLKPRNAPGVTIDPSTLAEFDRQPERTKTLIRTALDLAGRGLTYKYGSADPKNGGMDCSGTMFYILKQVGVKNVPRQSDLFYRWVWENGTLKAVAGSTFKSFEFNELAPGDLLFWTGTYSTPNRDPAISHVMLYLGTEKKTGRRLMVGSSDGRTYDSLKRNGVSVFDFHLPKDGKSARFVGYGRIPGFDLASGKPIPVEKVASEKPITVKKHVSEKPAPDEQLDIEKTLSELESVIQPLDETMVSTPTE